MQVNARRRPSSLEEIKSLKIIRDSSWSAILRKEVKPLFVPPVWYYAFPDLKYIKHILNFLILIFNQNLARSFKLWPLFGAGRNDHGIKTPTQKEKAINEAEIAVGFLSKFRKHN